MTFQSLCKLVADRALYRCISPTTGDTTYYITEGLSPVPFTILEACGWGRIILLNWRECKQPNGSSKLGLRALRSRPNIFRVCTAKHLAMALSMARLRGCRQLCRRAFSTAVAVAEQGETQRMTMVRAWAVRARREHRLCAAGVRRLCKAPVAA